MSALLTLNAGSSSMKFALYVVGEEPGELLHGQVDGIGGSAQLRLHTEDQDKVHDLIAPTHADSLKAVIEALEPHLSGLEISGVGHRIVHGGPNFSHAVLLTPEVIGELRGIEPLAPLHQPHNLDGVVAARNTFPDAIQIGCFDTAFHRGHPWVNDTFALPRKYYDEGIRRYGFHGLSYEYISGVLERDFPDLYSGRVIVAHLGNGASMCALKSGKSIASTMGFTALDGLPMGTRCGQIDPAVVLHLIEEKGMAPQEVMRMLYEESGLLGLSGETNDMRKLLASDRTEAAEAVDYYVARARQEIGALSAVLEGLDALIFSGGIGENAAVIRQRICQGMTYLGIEIDAGLNSGKAAEIGSGSTRVMVIPTDEERVIARAVSSAIRSAMTT